MSLTMITILLLSLLLISPFTTLHPTMAADPDILSDFVAPPPNPTTNSTTPTTGQYFTFSGMRAVFHQRAPNFTASKAGLAQFPALEGQSVSYAVLQFPSGTTNPPHIHPRASELLFVARGSLRVGLVDTGNKLYTQTLELGDMFVFPKGLVHFQYNVGRVTAVAFSAFGSANPGTVSLPPTLFTSGIDDDVLAKGFKSDVETIQSIKAGLSSA